MKYNEGNVVKDMKLGNTTVKICDDYCRGKTKEDVDKILDNIARIVINDVNNNI